MAMREEYTKDGEKIFYFTVEVRCARTLKTRYRMGDGVLFLRQDGPRRAVSLKKGLGMLLYTRKAKTFPENISMSHRKQKAKKYWFSSKINGVAHAVEETAFRGVL